MERMKGICGLVAGDQVNVKKDVMDDLRKRFHVTMKVIDKHSFLFERKERLFSIFYKENFEEERFLLLGNENNPSTFSQMCDFIIFPLEISRKIDSSVCSYFDEIFGDFFSIPIILFSIFEDNKENNDEENKLTKEQEEEKRKRHELVSKYVNVVHYSSSRRSIPTTFETIIDELRFILIEHYEERHFRSRNSQEQVNNTINEELNELRAEMISICEEMHKSKEQYRKRIERLKVKKKQSQNVCLKLQDENQTISSSLIRLFKESKRLYSEKQVLLTLREKDKRRYEEEIGTIRLTHQEEIQRLKREKFEAIDDLENENDVLKDEINELRNRESEFEEKLKKERKENERNAKKLKEMQNVVEEIKKKNSCCLVM